MSAKGPYQAAVIGTSMGGAEALKTVLEPLPEDFNMPIIIVQHIAGHTPTQLPHILAKKINLSVLEVAEKEMISGNRIYVAPANYHTLIEDNLAFSLASTEPVNFSRPSIDVLFESAAEAYRHHLIGIILTGANKDGALGLHHIKALGGVTVVQEPSTALADAMPKAAIETGCVDNILNLRQITALLMAYDQGIPYDKT